MKKSYIDLYGRNQRTRASESKRIPKSSADRNGKRKASRSKAKNELKIFLDEQEL